MKSYVCPVLVVVLTHMDIRHLPFWQSSEKYGYAPCVRQLMTKPGGHAYVAKVKETLRILDDASSSQLYVLMDAFDTYFRHPPAELVRRFNKIHRRLVVSSEVNFIYQPVEWKPFFDAQSKEESRYVNSGILMGYGDTMRMLLKHSANSSSLVLSSKRGADQAAVAEAIHSLGWMKLNCTLDYKQHLMYTASTKRWSLSLSNADIAKYDPVIVHFPFTAAPRVNRTFHASYDGQQGHPWPEADYEFCKAQEKLCAIKHDGAYCHVGGGHKPGMNRLAC
jgi:hypothetical protein